MTDAKGKAIFKIDWNPQTGFIHGEGNVTNWEALVMLELCKFQLERQMARGEGTGLLAETVLKGPALEVRRADHVD